MACHFGILLDSVAKNVGDHLSVIGTQGVKLFGNEPAYPDVLQTDGVDHTPGRGSQARRGRALHWFKRQALDDDTAEAIQIGEMCEFDPVAECATRGNNGIGQAHRANLYSKIHYARTAHGGLV